MNKVLGFLMPLIIICGAFSLASPSYADDSPTCTLVTIPVTLSSLDTTTYHVVGSLCWSGTLNGKTLQLLVHGYSYDHNYWDFPYEPTTYSYVRSAVQHDYATLSIDRIGAGLSDHPDPLSVSITSNAYILHQLIQDAREGSINNTSFSKVMLVGHSLGSIISLKEASTYSDIDGVIISGLLHTSNTLSSLNATSLYTQASQDPKFAQDNLPLGYLTTKPGTRGTLFYNLSDADAQVIATDEQLKQTGTDGEIVDAELALLPTVSQGVHVPVLIAVGQNDTLFCDGLLLLCNNQQQILTRELPYYNSHVCLEAYVLPQAGHVINLHKNAPDWYQTAQNWADRRVGNSSTTPPTQPCL